MANNPPPFIPPDLRVSPSGPYIGGPELGGAIVRMGCDCVVGAGGEVPLVTLTNGIGVIPRTQPAPDPDVPLQVAFAEWESTDLLWVAWHVSSSVGVNPEEAPPDAIQFDVQPIVDVGAGFQLIDPGGAGGLYSLPLLDGGLTDPITLAGHACIPITDPVQPPVVQLAYLLASSDDPQTPAQAIIVGVFGEGPTPSSAWLLALELDAARVFQTPPEAQLVPFNTP